MPQSTPVPTRVLVVVVALAVFTLAPSARAEAPADAQVAARDAFADGERLFARGAYQEALDAFERAFKLVSHDAVRFNIAVCLERLQRYRDARVQYLAARDSSTLGASDRTRAAQAVERVGRELGTVIVEGEPAGRPVAIDGEVRCSVPCRIALDPRTYRVAVGTDEARPVRVERGAELLLSHAVFAKQPSPPLEKKGEREARDEGRARGPSWLTWTGAAVAVLGTGSSVAFGLRTQSLHASYVDAPSVSTREQGLFARTMTNVSIGVAVTGLALVATDLLFFARRPEGEHP